ncbi:MAG: hypothetical protein R2686_07090 [Candidatus Nanopelagicales bacterium]
MATTTTISSLPVPGGADANDVPSDMSDLADAIDGKVILKLTGAAIAALSAPEKPAGTVFYNTTTGTLQISDGADVVDLPYQTIDNLRTGTVGTASYTTGGMSASFASPMTTTPILAVSQTVSAGTATPLHIMAFSVTGSGFSWKAFRLDTGAELAAGLSVTFTYIAAII